MSSTTPFSSPPSSPRTGPCPPQPSSPTHPRFHTHPLPPQTNKQPTPTAPRPSATIPSTAPRTPRERTGCCRSRALLPCGRSSPSSHSTAGLCQLVPRQPAKLTQNGGRASMYAYVHTQYTVSSRERAWARATGVPGQLRRAGDESQVFPVSRLTNAGRCPVSHSGLERRTAAHVTSVVVGFGPYPAWELISSRWCIQDSCTVLDYVFAPLKQAMTASWST